MKLDRAKQRMKELEEALQSFYATNPFKFSGKADLQAGKVVYTMDSVKDAPDEASLIAGEIIQNLRSALDHFSLPAFSTCWRNRSREEYLLSHWWGWRDKSESSLRERCTMSWREVTAERALSEATRIAGCSLRPLLKLAKRPDGLLMRGF